MQLVVLFSAMIICPITLAGEVEIESWEKQALLDIKALRCRELRVLVLDQAVLVLRATGGYWEVHGYTPGARI